jgi:hypothetical protein
MKRISPYKWKKEIKKDEKEQLKKDAKDHTKKYVKDCVKNDGRKEGMKKKKMNE